MRNVANKVHLRLITILKTVWKCATVLGVCMWVCVPAETRGIKSARTGIIHGYNPPDVGAGKGTQILYKSSKCF